MLSDHQFGFRPGSSTQEAILSAIRDWHTSLEKQRSVGCIFFDLSKAFDSLPHQLVLDSLAACGVSGSLLQWFVNYLDGCWQRVVLDGVSSGRVRVRSGVPQGSILGPLLFIISVDSLLRQSFSLSICMFADDIALYKELSSTGDEIALQTDVTMVEMWAESREFRLNVKKTKCLVVSRKRRPPVLKLTLRGAVIDQVGRYKYLGVTISNDLSWNDHISGVCCRARRMLGFLFRCFGRGAEPKALAHLFKSLVLPILGYCGSVWDPLYKTLIAKLERVQGFAARIVLGRWGATEDLRAELGWPLLVTRRSYQKLCLCRRILQGESLISANVFQPHPLPSGRRHVNSCPLFRQGVRTNYHWQSFFISVVCLWNAIPDAVVELPTQLAFKRHLKQYLVM